MAISLGRSRSVGLRSRMHAGHKRNFQLMPGAEWMQEQR